MAKYLKIGTEKYPAYPIGERFVTLLPVNYYNVPCLVLLDRDGSVVRKPGLILLPESWGVIEPGDISDLAKFTGGELVDE